MVMQRALRATRQLVGAPIQRGPEKLDIRADARGVEDRRSVRATIRVDRYVAIVEIGGIQEFDLYTPVAAAVGSVAQAGAVRPGRRRDGNCSAHPQRTGRQLAVGGPLKHEVERKPGRHFARSIHRRPSQCKPLCAFYGTPISFGRRATH